MSVSQVLVSFHEVAANLSAVITLRRLAWQRICRIQNPVAEEGRDALLRRLPRVCVLASSSRGGASVTAELLQRQGADCTEPTRRLLALPGEEKPHLILAGLAFPSRPERFDDLAESDAQTSNVSLLLDELRSEVGSPLPQCDDLGLYATQLYRRLLLQWPLSLAALDLEEAVEQLSRELRAAFPRGYRDTVNNRREVLAACLRSFPFIRPSFYDCWRMRSPADLTGWSGTCWSIEEAPFVLPPPWKNATETDLDQGCLLLCDRSNAWRLPFWRAICARQQMHVLHLVRDPHESVQGLCDGWNYPFGFQTMPSDEPLAIAGYTDASSAGSDEWKTHRLNFSVNRNLNDEVLQRRHRVSLAHVCARQWKDAHEAILVESAHLRLQRSIIDFADLRRAPETTFRTICASVGLEPSRSGLTYAQSFPDHWVMATAPATPVSHERWKSSPYSQEIRAIVSSGFFDDVCRELGLGKLRSNTGSGPPNPWDSRILQMNVQSVQRIYHA